MGLWQLLILVMMAATAAEAATDATDLKVLKELRDGVVGPLPPTWTSGNDPCGDGGSGGWQYVQCDGSSVTGLQLKGASLRGYLPASLNQLTNLQAIALQGNNFSGALPSLRGLGRLQQAFLDGQSFTSVPADFFSGLTSLSLLSLDYSPLNRSSGGWDLPGDVASLTSLTVLSLTATCLAGPIPAFLASLPNLRELRLAYNLLSGSIPAAFANASLSTLQLNNQQSPGKLSGPIDPVASIASLEVLWLHVNAFSGTIPPALGALVSLRDCRLNDNQLVGPIPITFSSSSSLTSFSVRHNSLDGPLPRISSLPPANFSYDGNLFCSDATGSPCPPEVSALLSFLSGVGYPLDLAQSWSLNDPCNSWIGVTCDPSSKNVITLNLPNHNLTGFISPSLANLTSLQNIILNNNQLTGTIPASLATLPSLKRLSLQNNNLYAPVPSLPGVNVNFAGNPNIDKIGPAPIVPSSSTSDTSNGSTNGGTTTGPSSTSSILQSTASNRHKHSNVAALASSIAGAACIALLGAILALFLIRKKRRYSRVQSPNTFIVHPAGGPNDPAVVKVTVGNRVADVSQTQSHVESIAGSDVQVVETGNLVISIQVLRNVTDNFSQENVLGRGGFGVVYKGELDDGTKIAVKRMEASVVSNKGLNEFRAEIAVLTKVRHRHLVALLGYCIDGNERLLVYEYMPLGPLSQHLFEYAKLGLPPLNLKRRLSIALDVARGMEYLHGLAQTSFIHRDLKPSNILLGDDYRAKVSDFGLVKLASDDKSAVETRLAGTFGYLAPEYAVTGRVTTKSDVFSFGVVLMELLTGRRALDESQPEESVHLVAWFRRTIASKDDFARALDPALELADDTSLHSVSAVAELAGHCTMREAWQRPDMSHAVNVLSPLVEQWTPADVDGDEGIGIDLDLTLPQALKKWQAYEGATSSSASSAFFSRGDLDDTKGSMPSRPAGFAESFTSSDGR